MTETENEAQPEPLFVDINADEQSVTEITSLCLACHDEGMTRLMLTKIPFFKEVILSSFSCDACGHSDSEVQFGGRIQDKGHRITLTVKNLEDMNRQLVKSDWASLSIPAIDFEQPPSKKGEVTTIEGLLSRMISSLDAYQPLRRIEDPENAAKLDEFLEKARNLMKVEEPFTVTVDDPSGNSHIENPHAPKPDEQLKVMNYVRTKQHDIIMGLVADDDEEEEDADKEFCATEESLGFPDNCPECNAPCMVQMKVTDIPFFKQVVLMATNCDTCGFRESEVKGGAGIEDKGKRISLKVTSTDDLTRDLLKSDTCGVEIPELELELEEGTLGGKFTTIEGLLINIKDQLTGKIPFTAGDSVTGDKREEMAEFMGKLEKMISGETLDYHLVLDDPAGNSYLQNIHSPEEDPHMEITDYERNFDQNEMLGLNDMKTENYDES